MKLNLEEGRCREEVFFEIWFYFSLSYSDLFGDKLNKFFQVESVLLMSSSSPYLDP